MVVMVVVRTLPCTDASHRVGAFASHEGCRCIRQEEGQGWCGEGRGPCVSFASCLGAMRPRSGCDPITRMAMCTYVRVLRTPYIDNRWLAMVSGACTRRFRSSRLDGDCPTKYEVDTAQIRCSGRLGGQDARQRDGFFYGGAYLPLVA